MPRTARPRSSTRRISPPSPKSRDQFRILLATAGGSDSRSAIQMAATLASRLPAQVTAVTVVSPFPHLVVTGLEAAPPAVIDEHNRSKSIAQVRRQLASVPGTADWKIESMLGWPADAIPMAASKLNASLIIIGHRRHHFMDRFIGAETAVAMARHTRVPMLIIPPGHTTPPTHAVAAIDFTPSSIAAAQLAARLLGPAGRLTLAHASLLARATAEPGTLLDVYAAGAKAKLADIAREIHSETGVTVDCEVVDGEIASTVLDYAKRSRDTLLAIGSHTHGLVERLMMGSVRTEVVRHISQAVLIVPMLTELPSVGDESKRPRVRRQ